MNEREELLACPFCGGKPNLETYSMGSAAISCEECLVMSPMGADANMATRLWNRRCGLAQGATDCDAEDFDALRELEIARLTANLCSSISNLGYPVGMGISPNPEQMKKAATILFERYAKMIAMSRGVALSSTQEKSPKSFNPLDAGFSLVDDGRICRVDDPDCRHPLCDCARYVNEQRASAVISTQCHGAAK